MFSFLTNFISGCQLTREKIKIAILWKDDKINSLIGNVSEDSLKSTITELQGFGTRYTHEKQNNVAEYIHNLLKQQGYDVKYDTYKWKGKSWKNVELTLSGKNASRNYFVLGAHYDSISETPSSKAPGADDNASGVAALLELVRVMKGYEVSNTIRVVFFSNEEKGYLGSKNYVKSLKKIPSKYLGAIIVDTIGSRHHPDCKLTIATKPKFKWLAESASQVLNTFGDLPEHKLRIDKYCS